MRSEAAARRGQAAWVHAHELATWLSEGRPLDVIDVREPRLYAMAHVHGSRNQPDSNTAGLVRSLNSERDTILICDDGNMSKQVARTLDFCGYHRVSYLSGGVDAWRAEGHEIESSRPPTVRLTVPAETAATERIKTLAESTVHLMVQVPRAVTGRLVTIGLLAAGMLLALTVFWAVIR